MSGPLTDPVQLGEGGESLSIITPCLNRVGMIREAIDSVVSQGYPQVEHIVVDGGSTDGTLEVLADYPHLTVISGPDRGLYDALNKGIAAASGAVVGLLNSDDHYLPGVFEQIMSEFARQTEVELLSGGAVVFRESGADGASGPILRRFPTRSHGLLIDTNVTMGVPIINARFFRRALLTRVGPFALDYPVAADREWLLRLLTGGVTQAVIEQDVMAYREHAGSLTTHQRSPRATAHCREHLAIAGHYLDAPTTPSRVRQVCAQWYQKDAVVGAIEALRSGRLAEAWQFACAGTARSLWWPLHLVGSGLWRLLRLRWLRDTP